MSDARSVHQPARWAVAGDGSTGLTRRFRRGPPGLHPLLLTRAGFPRLFITDPIL
jgi:hypothetical protein